MKKIFSIINYYLKKFSLGSSQSNKEISKLINEKNLLIKKRDDLKSDINLLNTKIDSLNNEKIKFKKNINLNSSKINSKVSELNKNNEDLIFLDDESRREKAKSNKKIQDKKIEIQEKNQKLKEMISSLKLENLSANTNIDNINNDISNLSKRSEDSKTELDKLNINILENDDLLSNQKFIKGLQENRKKLLITLSILSFPIFLFAIYFYGIGRARFYVETDVLVRKTASSSESGGSLLSILGGGNQAAQEDARYLKIYLESPQVLEDVSKIINFQEVYEKKGIDFYSGIKKNISKEKLYVFFKKQVVITLDEISGSLNIETLAYDPKTAYDFNKFLIKQAEKFVNELNQNIYLRQIDFINSQVILNLEKLDQAKLKFQEFQNRTKILNLDQEVSSSTNIINILENQMSQAKLELSVLKNQFIDKNAPEIKYMQNKVEEIKNQIKDQRNILLNPGSKNYAKRIAKSASLKSNLDFWSKIYSSSLATLEKTKLDSQKQQRFIAILSKPIYPEEQNIYWRNKWFLTFSLSILLGYFITRFLLGIAESHNN